MEWFFYIVNDKLLGERLFLVNRKFEFGGVGEGCVCGGGGVLMLFVFIDERVLFIGRV